MQVLFYFLHLLGSPKENNFVFLTQMCSTLKNRENLHIISSGTANKLEPKIILFTAKLLWFMWIFRIGHCTENRL